MNSRRIAIVFGVAAAVVGGVASAQQQGGGSLFGGGQSAFGQGGGFGQSGGGFGQGGFGQGGFGQSAFGQPGFGGAGFGGGGFGQGGQAAFGGGQNGGGFVGRDGADAANFFGQLGRGLGQFQRGRERTFGQGGNRGRGADQTQERRPPVRVQLTIGFKPSTAPAAVSRGSAQRIVASLNQKGVRNASVSITDGVAVLSGLASSESDRRLAERIARLEPGVSRVDNRLTVAPAGGELIPPGSGT